MKLIYRSNPLLLVVTIIFLVFPITMKVEAKIELLDRVIAVVDTGVIMESELNTRVKDIIGRLRNDGMELPPKQVLEEQVLERLIVEEIQLQIGYQACV